VDKEKIYDFLIKGSKLIGALAVFLALFVGAVKYANKDFQNKVEKELDTIKNNHIYHLGLDLKENKKEHEDFKQELRDIRRESAIEFKELRRENAEEHKEMKKEIIEIKTDMSYIKGLLEKQFGIKK
jgi:uncharacterized protein HemX